MASPNPHKRPLEGGEEDESQKRSKNDEDATSETSFASSSDDDSSSESSSDSSSDSSDSDSDGETEATSVASKTPDLRVCPLRSLVNAYEERSYSPIQPDQDSGPVDPVFVDEESSGEAVASAADQDDLEMMPPLPPIDEVDENQPPLPLEEPQVNTVQPPAQPEPANDLEEPVIDSEVPTTEAVQKSEGTKMDEKASNSGGDNQEDKAQKSREINLADCAFDDSDESLPEDELDALLEKDVVSAKKDSIEPKVPVLERTKFKMIEKGKNHFDVLPNGWVVVEHVSGMPIYLHRPSRSVTLSRPYHLGTASARRHPIPLNAIPCLNYRKALDEEEAVKQREKNGSIFPVARVESVEDSMKKASLSPEEYREYCQQLFLFKQTTVKKFRSWAERRTHQRQERDATIKEMKNSVESKNNESAPTSEKSKQSRPALPEGTKIISIPVFEMEQEDPNAEENPLRQKIVRKSKKDWVLNPAGKSTVCILHEYLQHSVKKAPEYKYQEMESSATPYSAVVVINGIEYGRGVGSSKKEAKSEAARLTLEILIPEFKNHLIAKNGYVTKEAVDLSFFDDIRIEDPRVPELCNKMSEPSPYAILLNCLQRNYGLGDTNIKTDLTPARNRKYNKFSMTVNEKTVEVTCRSKRDGKQIASQKLLQILHPNIKSWGSLLKMYGSRAITAQKNKKEKESEVTGLQTQNGSGHTSPNVAILAKLRQEMHVLAERKKSVAPLGKLSWNDFHHNSISNAATTTCAADTKPPPFTANEQQQRINL